MEQVEKSRNGFKPRLSTGKIQTASQASLNNPKNQSKQAENNERTIDTQQTIIKKTSTTPNENVTRETIRRQASRKPSNSATRHPPERHPERQPERQTERQPESSQTTSRKQAESNQQTTN